MDWTCCWYVCDRFGVVLTSQKPPPSSSRRLSVQPRARKGPSQVAFLPPEHTLNEVARKFGANRPKTTSPAFDFRTGAYA